MLATKPQSEKTALPQMACGCGAMTRFRGKNGEPLCGKCSRKDRTCVRCNKPLPRANKAVDGGFVCGTCVIYYREPKQCPRCGFMSQRLSRCASRGFTKEPVCERCRRTGDVRCATCNRGRFPTWTRADGKPICKQCMERGDNPFICPTCEKPGRPHSKTMCTDCYWRNNAENRFNKMIVLLTNEWSREVFHKFFFDLIKRQHPKITATTLKQYYLFFSQLDAAFNDSKLITTEYLITTFGAEGFRKNTVPIGFLIKENIIPEVSQDLLAESSQLNFQKNILQQAEGTWYAPALNRFYVHLIKIHERYKRRGWVNKRSRYVLRTITASLRAAFTFLNFVTEKQNITSLQQIDQSVFELFCNEHKGYKTSISAFIIYVNKNEKLFSKISKTFVFKNLPVGTFLSTSKRSELLTGWLNPTDNLLKESLIGLLMLLYAQTAIHIVRIKLQEISKGRDGLYRIAFGRTTITLDKRVGEILGRYLEKRSAMSTMEDIENNEYLFTGRSYGGHLTEAAFTYYLKRNGVTSKQLCSTAIYNAYMNGMHHPKVLVKAFGITDETAIKYLNLIDPHLNLDINNKVAHV